jgi:predicted P-loop ATPase
MTIGGHVIGQWAAELSDAASFIVRQAIIDNFGFDPGKDNVADAATELCFENSFDPILNYLNNLKWDCSPRVGNWLSRYLGAEDTELHRAIGRLSLIAAVRRVRKPGCKSDQITVLEGPEGTMKSTAIETLAGTENFSDQTILTQSDKEQQELVRGVWLFELADLAGMKRADVEKVKAFASRARDRARPAYGRRRVDEPRRCVFFGTTNESEYLKSQTGNRRIWPVKTGIIDIDALKRDRDQIWAEAAKLESEGASLVLPEELWTAARAAQEERRECDPWEDVLADIQGDIVTTDQGAKEERISSREILTTKLGIADKDATYLEALRLKRTMNALGWAGPKKIRFGNKSERGYYRPTRGGE